MVWTAFHYIDSATGPNQSKPALPVFTSPVWFFWNLEVPRTGPDLKALQLADESDVVPNLKKKNYSDFYLRKRDWDKLELMHEVLKICY